MFELGVRARGTLSPVQGRAGRFGHPGSAGLDPHRRTQGAAAVAAGADEKFGGSELQL